MQAQGELLKAKKNTLSHAQLFQLGDFIRERCKRTDAGGVYGLGYDDDVIVETFSQMYFQVTLSNVIHARHAAVGALATSADITLEALALRVATLETLVKGLTK